MNAQQLKNAILQDLYSSKDGWNIKELKDVVADSCPISYGIVQQGNHVDGGVPVVRPVDLHTKYVGKVNLKCTSKDISNSYKRTVLNGNEVLLCVRGTTGIVALATEELKGCNVNRGIVPLYFGDDVDKLFIYYQLQAPFVQETIEENTMGSALKQINIKDLRTLKLLVPPLAEQHRIVAKIEELLPKVEEYGKAQEALDKLNEELPERLKKSVLQEAITGRLVPQDPNDEPASVLLQRIRAEKERLVKEGKLKKKDLEETPISEDEIPFEIPESWEWVRLADLFEHSSGKQLRTSDTEGTLHEYITTSNLYWGRFELSKLKSMYYKDSEIEKCTAKKGDLLVCEGGDIGRSAIWSYDYDVCLQNHVHRLRPYDNRYTIFVFYVMWYYKSAGFIGGKGIGIQGLSASSLKSIAFPLPPLAEQKRIVAKIEELFAVLDSIKESLEA